MVLNCWLARESISTHLFSFFFYSPFTPRSFTLFLFPTCSPTHHFLLFALFKHHQKVTTKDHHCLINAPWSAASTRNIFPFFLSAASACSFLLSPSAVHILLRNRSGRSVLMKLLWVLICGQLWTLRGRAGLEEEWRRNGWMKVAEGVVKSSVKMLTEKWSHSFHQWHFFFDKNKNTTKLKMYDKNTEIRHFSLMKGEEH